MEIYNFYFCKGHADVCRLFIFYLRYFLSDEIVFMGRRSKVDALGMALESKGRFFFPIGVIVCLAVVRRPLRAASLYQLLLMGYALQDVIYFFLQRLVKWGVESKTTMGRMQV